MQRGALAQPRGVGGETGEAWVGPVAELTALDQGQCLRPDKRQTEKPGEGFGTSLRCPGNLSVNLKSFQKCF